MIDIPWMVQKQVKGHVVRETDDTYVIDFTREAKKAHYVGDYSAREVWKGLCSKIE